MNDCFGVILILPGGVDTVIKAFLYIFGWEKQKKTIVKIKYVNGMRGASIIIPIYSDASNQLIKLLSR